MFIHEPLILNRKGRTGAVRKIFLDDLCQLARAAKGNIDCIYLHWSAGHYGQPFANYHINIDYDGSLLTSVASLSVPLAHTWQRNYRSVGVAMLCCALATPHNLGNEPPTELQIEAMAQVVAVLCRELELPVDFYHVRTHAEQADLDGYGPATTWERWDLWILRQGDPPGSGGHVIRGKALWYLQRELKSMA